MTNTDRRAPVVPSRPSSTRLPCQIVFVCLLAVGQVGNAQQSEKESKTQVGLMDQVERLIKAVTQAQEQVDASQQQLRNLRQQLNVLQMHIAQQEGGATEDSAPLTYSSAQENVPAQSGDEAAEQRSMQQTQIATLDQSKVESESKYPVKLSGLILLNGFVNTGKVDQAAAPTVALGGSGSTGASIRQTVLGIDARGPHLAGALSRADLRVDFFGGATQGGYTDTGGLLRLRTAHATLNWKNTEALVELDRPIISPNAPSSLVAVAEPALAWSGNLWAWSPQVAISHTLLAGDRSRMRLQAALIDPPDPPRFSNVSASNVTLSEESRWPGTEARIALVRGDDRIGPQFGLGGYYAPHRTLNGIRFDSWAGTLDYRLPLPRGFELSGSAYRGQALGGLGGGGYKDYAYRVSGTDRDLRALDDVGGWAQLKERFNERLEFNAAFGVDNVFASQLRPYVDNSATAYQSLARNRTFFGNAIFSPSAYLLFSLEYRRISTSPVFGPTWNSNVIGIAAGYRF